MLIEIIKRIIPLIIKKVGAGESLERVLEEDEELKRVLIEQENTFRRWVIQYEGGYKDMPYFIRIMRALLRPIITYGTWGVTVWLLIIGKDIPAQLWVIDHIVLVFWFGEAAVSRAIETIKTGIYRGR